MQNQVLRNEWLLTALQDSCSQWLPTKSLRMHSTLNTLTIIHWELRSPTDANYAWYRAAGEWSSGFQNEHQRLFDTSIQFPLYC